MLRTIGMNNNKYKSAAAHQNFYCVMENNGNAKEDLKDMVERGMEERFGWLRIMLQLTGLMYFTEERPIWRRLKIARATILISLAIYQLLFVLRLLLNHGKFDLINSRSLIIFSWIFQAVISMGFLIYYQWNRQICRLRDVIYCQNGCPKTPKVIKSTIIFTCTLLLITCVSILLVIIFQDQGWVEANSVLDDKLHLMYGYPHLFPLTMFIFFWAMYVWTSALTFFICIVTALNHEKHIQPLEIDEDEVEEGDMDGIGNELQECYVHHVSLANRVRVINDTFEVYTFTLLGCNCNVPTTIFCLLSFLLSLSHQNFNLLHILISVPDLLFCLFELIGLTSSPAKVHATIRDVESIIYRNMRIWKPYNEKVYRLASVFIAVDFHSVPHANQSNLGITLWGFAVVTKPLILTMISLTISYLTFVLQVRPEKSAGGNETLHFSFN